MGSSDYSDYEEKSRRRRIVKEKREEKSRQRGSFDSFDKRSSFFLSIFYIYLLYQEYILGDLGGSRTLYKLNNIIFFSRSVKKF